MKSKGSPQWLLSTTRTINYLSEDANADKNKIKKSPPRSFCWSIASLSFRLIFLCLGHFDKLRNEKLPFYERDGNIGEKDEPRHWVHAPVEDVCHFVQMLIQKQI